MFHLLRRLARAVLPVAGGALCLCGPLRPALADQTLWYNGDPSGNVLINCVEPQLIVALPPSDYEVFDDFQVTAPGGWSIHSAWINGIDFGLDNLASWSIRSGVASGVPGTVIASGQLPVSNSPGPDGTTTTALSGLSVNLLPGTYWLELTPIGPPQIHLSTTEGANAVGTPAGNDGNAFFNSTGVPLPVYFESTVAYQGPGYHDFSMGVAGAINPPPPSPTPEPTSMALLTAGGIPLLGFLRRRKLA